MNAEKRIRTVDHHEWSLPQPAHHTEVEKAVAAAEHDRAALATRGARTGDVHVHGGDSQLIVSFEAERPKVAKRGRGFETELAEAPDA